MTQQETSRHGIIPIYYDKNKAFELANKVKLRSISAWMLEGGNLKDNNMILRKEDIVDRYFGQGNRI